VTSISQLAATVRGRRKLLGFSQAQLAARAGVSRQWIGELEAGKPTAELGLVLRLLEALELRLSLDENGPGSEHAPTVDLDDVLDAYDG
jgi:HTH-type transcriptional regulator/antitoxin HipB